MSAVKAVASVLKGRFSNLTVEETIDLADKIVTALKPELDLVWVEQQKRQVIFEKQVQGFTQALDASKCGHGRLHIFCGQCNITR